MKTIYYNYNLYGKNALEYDSSHIEKRIVELYKDIHNIEEEINIFRITFYDGKYFVCANGKEDYPLGTGRFLDKDTCLNYIESALINEAKDILRVAKRLEKYNFNIEDE